VLVVGMHRDPAGGSLPGAIAHRAAVLSLRPLTQNEAAAVPCHFRVLDPLL
jgi:hypothetical protein